MGILKSRVAGRSSNSIKELGQILQEEWNSIDQKVIDFLIQSTSHRFQMVQNEGGKSIGHLLHRIRKGSKNCVDSEKISETRNEDEASADRIISGNPDPVFIQHSLTNHVIALPIIRNHFNP